MIVAYVSPKDTVKRAQLLAMAQDEPMTFRDPDTFTAADADPLDRVVYAAGDAAHIRAVYAGLPNATLYSLDDSPLATPERSFAQRRQQQKAQRVGQPIDAAAVPNVHGPDLTNQAMDPDVPLVAANHLEGIKRVDAVPIVRQRSGRFDTRPDMFHADAPMLTDEEAAAGVTVAPATEGLFRPNSSAGLQHTAPEPAPVVTLQKPATEPPQTRPRGVPGLRREQVVARQEATPAVAVPMRPPGAEGGALPLMQHQPTPSAMTPKAEEAPKDVPKPIMTETPKP